ncbi:hypothetical protein UA08_07020 [Talaromyces atroroseus]|uniref:S-adenosyl-L-methionine-dependent methyltransferase n=1 Tax=Talaromyces atroroseus TaxID=1441469 RepID=A0A225AFA7_TALAT|nr:hypothetical protein UA08_07020 [Talaromyces atroroseus]OKL57793.1 hypothetical protein UA08_07020 [Talaromyces atroroseus]
MKTKSNNLYGLDHAILNVTVPPESMWMNMGYWKNTTLFQGACQALLDQVLIMAGLLGQHESSAVTPTSLSSFIKIIDVGFGCGDQSLYLTRKLHRTMKPSENTVALSSIDPSNDGDGAPSLTSDHKIHPLFDSYVGINITPSQVEIAQRRLLASGDESTLPSPSTQKVEVFLADAGNPASWDTKLKEAVYSEFTQNTEQNTQPAMEMQTWLLALDTLYHFKPSRMPLFECAYKDMQASIMAFDLLMSDNASLWDRFRLRLMCLFTGIPYSNFMTKKEYKAMLTLAGYEHSMIEMQDISEHVFSGIANYIRTKEAELGVYGMTLGKFKAAGNAFGWWATTGVVKGLEYVQEPSEENSFSAISHGTSTPRLVATLIADTTHPSKSTIPSQHQAPTSQTLPFPLRHNGSVFGNVDSL